MKDTGKGFVVKASIGDMMLSKLVQKDKAKEKRLRQFVTVQLQIGNPSEKK